MKKLLILLSLTTAMTAFGNNNTNPANMNVSATIMETLTVRVDQPAEFGKIAKGTSGNTAIGRFSVKGQGNNQAKITISGLTNNGKLTLRNISGATISADVDHTEETLSLKHDEFVAATPIRFTLNVPDNQQTGLYEGNVTIQARYN
ncbi:hypothetical protein HMPREF0202_02176 [Cetobacterium somerae ATCC BAA-474]|uniref:DUF4402 domain-containing protein n=1 Tax=Cetobacterium somerae ATCC BAA-474 TaxID=1319815 RepID=U7VAX1_9FUSO|nr:DUF4402 domain-containing protein [Cetobacterium somerae]ERT67958.1 hypothetical protein HMPREF0202_02176 [Cetobacterium somerae ATCC BAA-474]